MASGHGSDVFHHIRDSHGFEVPRFLGTEWPLPSIFGFQITKYMVLEVIAAVLVLVIFRGLAKRIQNGEPVSGRWGNFWEFLALYIRDEVVRPVIGTGHHDHGDGEHAEPDPSHGHPADKYLPFIWWVFFFVLICNLLGMIPWMGSPTANIWATGAIALTTFVVVLAVGMMSQGVVGYWKGLCPEMDLPIWMAPPMIAMIWAIEFLGLLIKHGVLAVRLFANMMGGHTVIFVMLTFIAQTGGMTWGLGLVVTPASVLGQIGVSLLELLVAFIQAYIFAFLATLFISMSLNPH